MRLVTTTWKALLVALLALLNSIPASTVYAGTIASGLFKSTNGGATWSAVNIGLPNTSVSALVIDPQTPGTVYTGTIRDGVFKSTNGGNWFAINSGLTNTWVEVLAIDPQASGTAYAGTYYGVFAQILTPYSLYQPIIQR